MFELPTLPGALPLPKLKENEGVACAAGDSACPADWPKDSDGVVGFDASDGPAGLVNENAGAAGVEDDGPKGFLGASVPELAAGVNGDGLLKLWDRFCDSLVAFWVENGFCPNGFAEND